MTVATTLERRKQFADSSTNRSNSLTFNQFDPSLGRLQSIDVGLVGNISG